MPASFAAGALFRQVPRFFKPADPILAILTGLLASFGLLMITSSSAFFAAERFGDPYYFMKKEMVFVAVGILIALAVQRIPVSFWRDHVYGLLAFSGLLVLAVWVPGVGVKAGGAQRWIRILTFSFQPSELVKLALVVFMAYSLAKKGDKVRQFIVAFLPHSVIPGIFLAAILAQSDFGTVATLGAVILVLLFVGGLRPSHLAAALILFIPALVMMIASASYRRERIMAFLDPWSHRLDSGFQMIQSLVSFKSGGLTGLGLGAGQQKLFFLPEAHTDFILAVVAEELGFIGVASCLVLFMLFVLRALRISFSSSEPFRFYLGTGLSFLLGFQIVLNAAVVMALLPTKGMPLPFLSYGGSNLIISFVAVGILMALAKEGPHYYREGRL